MTWLASAPAEIDLERARQDAKDVYDNGAVTRIGEHALAIYIELRHMQSVHRARNARANAVSRVCGILKTTEFAEALDELIKDPKSDGAYEK